jgi:hypothetical protein
MPQGLCPKPLPLEFPEYKSSEVRRWEFYFKKKQIIEKTQIQFHVYFLKR